MKFRSLKYRILFWFIGMVSIILCLFSFALYYFLEQSIHLRIKTNLSHQTTLIYKKIIENKKIDNIIDISGFNGLEAILFKNKKIISQTKEFSLKNPSSYINSNKIFFTQEVDEYMINASYILKFTKPFEGTLIVHKKGLFNKAEDIENILFVLNPILLIILIFISSKLIDKILIPIKNITKATKDISVNNFSKTMNLPKKNDEIKQLTESFNDMIIRLKDGVARLDCFNNDISHELKTPLTVIQGEIEVTLRKIREPNYYIKSMKTVLEETKEIKKLVESLLLITKYSKQNIQTTFSICNLDSILINICEKYDNNLKNKNIKLHIEKLDAIKLNANEILITSIFSNLIDNAIKYTPNNKNIFISLFKSDRIYFIIRDEGIGIEENNLDKITNRFYRVDESRNKEIKGFGLGLSIVKNSLSLHNAKLKISSKILQGTTVQLIFST